MLTARHATLFQPAALPARGIQVQQVWGGDLLDERSFAQPTRVTLGPSGTFVLPAAGPAGAVALLEPFQGGFGLRLDAGDGWLELDGIRRSFEELRRVLAPLAHAPVVRLGAGAKAEVCWGTFCFEITAVDVPVQGHEVLNWRHAVPLAVSLVVATASTVGPLLVGLAMPGDRVQWRDPVRESVPPRDIDYVEVVVPAEPVAVEVEAAQPQDGPASDLAPPLAPPLAPSRPTVHQPAPRPPNPAEPTKVDVRRTANEIVDRLVPPLPAEDGGKLDLAGRPGDAPASALPDVPDNPGGGPSGPFGHGDDLEQLARPGPARIETRTVTLQVKVPKQMVIPPQQPKVSAQGLSAAEVRGLLREHHGAFKHCYQIGVQRKPDLQGRLVLALVIAPQGQVLSSRIEDSDLGDDAVEDCIAAAAKELRFPTSRDGQPTQVHYPLRMRAP